MGGSSVGTGGNVPPPPVPFDKFLEANVKSLIFTIGIYNYNLCLLCPPAFYANSRLCTNLRCLLNYIIIIIIFKFFITCLVKQIITTLLSIGGIERNPGHRHQTTPYQRKALLSQLQTTNLSKLSATQISVLEICNDMITSLVIVSYIYFYIMRK